MAIYEVHLGSWARVPEDGNRFLTYRELAARLVPYVKELGFTHIELLPVMEHPFSGSWGYQVLGFFAPTSRFGSPEDFKYFVDACHRAGIGVILDWVPGHFPKDEHGLAALRRHGALRARRPAAGRAPGLGHADLQLRAQRGQELPAVERAVLAATSITSTACASTRSPRCSTSTTRAQEGQWIPNRYGGRENLEAISFLQRLNTLTHGEQPGTITAAEESTVVSGRQPPRASRRAGFTYKWNMGWMHDMLRYAGLESRASPVGAHPDHVLRPLHVHGELHPAVLARRGRPRQGAMLDKMPGDVWQKHATLRALYGFMYAHPGKKLLFMGSEFGQWREWNHDRSLDWHLLDDPLHAGLRRYVQALNWQYSAEPALHEQDFDPSGFRWIDCNDNENSVISLVRYARGHSESGDRRRQLHAGPAGRIPDRRPGAWLLCRAAEQRRAPHSAEATSGTAAASTASRSRRTGSISRCA